MSVRSLTLKVVTPGLLAALAFGPGAPWVSAQAREQAPGAGDADVVVAHMAQSVFSAAASTIAPLATGATGPIGPIGATVAPTAKGTKVIYLTFDDGPSPRYTPQILSVLKRNHASATFFTLGNQAQASPSLLRAIKASGSKVANHSWNHPSLTSLSNAAIRSQVSRTDRVIGRTACMRPPYGATNSRVRSVLSSMGKRQVLWTVDTNDWRRPGSATLVNRILKGAKPGAVILMHDGGGNRSQTVAAISKALPILTARGYTVRALPYC